MTVETCAGAGGTPEVEHKYSESWGQWIDRYRCHKPDGTTTVWSTWYTSPSQSSEPAPLPAPPTPPEEEEEKPPPEEEKPPPVEKVKAWIVDTEGNIHEIDVLPGTTTYAGTTVYYSYSEAETRAKELLPPPPPPPPERKIIGTVTDAVFHGPITFATITFQDKSATSGGDGLYEITEPAKVSGPITCSAPEYETAERLITAPVTGSLIVDFELSRPPAPPKPEYPEMPAGIPTNFIPLWNDLKDALLAKDANRVLTILRTGRDVEGSPVVFLGFVLSIAAIVKLILAVVGSLAFAKFLLEETLQTIDMAYYESSQAGQWDLAQKALNKKNEIINPSIIDTIVSFIPGVNVVHAVLGYIDASRTKLDIDEELVDRQSPPVQEPAPGDVEGASSADEAGEPMDPYMPTPYLPTWAHAEINENKADISTWYWSTKNRITAEDWEGASSDLASMRERIDNFGAWTETNKALLEKTKKYESVATYIDSQRASADALEAQIEAEVLPTTGTLEIISIPDGADVYIDDELYTYPTNTVIDELTPTTYDIKLTKTGYEDYLETVTIKAGERSTISATLSALPAPPVPTTGTLKCTSAPSGANVLIENVVKGITPVDLELTPGTHHVTFALEGYGSETMTGLAKAGEVTTLSATLEELPPPPPEKGRVDVMTDPVEVEVSIPEGVLGTTGTDGKLSVEVDPGTYSITFRKEGYEDKTTTTFVVAGEVRRLSIKLSEVAPPPPTRGMVRITTSPPEVEVLSAGAVLGTTDETGSLDLPLDKGTYDLEFSKAEYESSTRRVYVYPGEETILSLTLEPIEKLRKLWRVDCSAKDPEGNPLPAKILVNDSFTGEWTPGYVLLEPGSYDFTFVKSGYETALVHLELEAIE